MAKDRINVAVVGLGFGAEFVPIYLDHPNVESVMICDSDNERLNNKKKYTDFSEIINSDEIDAVHLVSGIPDHAEQTLDVLNSGKHCACAVPMATSIEDIWSIVNLQKETGLNYMMMETAVYTRPFLFSKDLKDKGEFGKIQFLRGAHYQDMEGWPPYWAGLPPMWYATHAISPLLAIGGSRATKVHCYGSGKIRDELVTQYDNPYAIETAIFELDSPDLRAEVTRSLFHCARPYMESFTIYGENACYEWQMEDESPVLFRMSPVVPGEHRTETLERPELLDHTELLPQSIRKYTKRFVYDSVEKHLSFEQGGGHHGSHPHLVNEFVSSIIEGRQPWIDAVTSATWTAAGICAHKSAMMNGAEIMVPKFDD
jgi:predicted dehydrogenase